MLNTTLLGLTTLLLANSPFSLSQSSQYRNFQVDKSVFSKSLQNLFYFNAFAGKALFRKTTFDNILGGAIRVDSISYDAKDLEINERFAPNIMSQNFYAFESCMFRRCLASGERVNGGAISITVPAGRDFDVDLSLEFSSFYACRCSGGQGGAIYGFRIGDVDIKETCFEECTTHEDSSTGDTGMGTAVYAWHRADTERSRARGSSFTKCPGTSYMNPNTETVFFILMGQADTDDTNFTQNFIEKEASAIAFLEQHICEVDYTSFINCTGECTVYFSGHDNSISDINTVNFVGCKHHSEAKNPAIIRGLSTTITLENCVFILDGNRFLAANAGTDSTTHFTFSGCQFDASSKENLNDQSIMTFNSDCKFGSASTHEFTYFDSRECWEIEPDRLPASDSVYAFFIFFILFAAIVAFGVFLQVTQVLGIGSGVVVSEKYDAPAISEPINKASYDAIPE